MNRQTGTALGIGLLVLVLGAYRFVTVKPVVEAAVPSAPDHLAAIPAEDDSAAQAAFAALERAELADDLAALVTRADAFLAAHRTSALAVEVARRRSAYLERIDEQGIAAARAYQADHPEDFLGRRAAWHRYLDRHPAGRFVNEAREQLTRLAAEAERHAYRQVWLAFHTRPFDSNQVCLLCRAYRAAHPAGGHHAVIAELERWCERVVDGGEYRVTLLSGSFERSAKTWLSRGPRLAVELEVAGVRHGPSPIALQGFEPSWNYEFPRRIRWKPGDAVAIRVVDHWYWQRTIVDTVSEANDPFALRLLSQPIYVNDHLLRFASDFHMPDWPEAE
jgi:hypothetical protein